MTNVYKVRNRDGSPKYKIRKGKVLLRKQAVKPIQKKAKVEKNSSAIFINDKVYYDWAKGKLPGIYDVKKDVSMEWPWILILADGRLMGCARRVDARDEQKHYNPKEEEVVAVKQAPMAAQPLNKLHGEFDYGKLSIMLGDIDDPVESKLKSIESFVDEVSRKKVYRMTLPGQKSSIQVMGMSKEHVITQITNAISKTIEEVDVIDFS